MTSPASSTPRRQLAALGQAALPKVVDSGLLRCAVPPGLGGAGGSLADLAEGARAGR